MKVVVIANNGLKEQWLITPNHPDVIIKWTNTIDITEDATCYIDMLFTYSQERITKLQTLRSDFIIVNEVTNCLSELPSNFVRFNGWPGFITSALVETTGPQHLRQQVEEIFSFFGKKTEWVPDIPGLITPRIISMIINEAYYALGDQVSTKEEIDTAMKLGTNYPYGPFEWAEIIGIDKIHSLLNILSRDSARYKPAPHLLREATT